MRRSAPPPLARPSVTPDADHAQEAPGCTRASRRIALVGENGAGKTTLAKLLLGLYEPTAGRILVDGVPRTEVDPGTWRRCVAGSSRSTCASSSPPGTTSASATSRG